MYLGVIGTRRADRARRTPARGRGVVGGLDAFKILVLTSTLVATREPVVELFVLALLVHVANDERDGGAGGLALVHPRQDLYQVVFAALRDVP